MSLPSVSVIMAAFNAEAYLLEAIESILAQRGAELEIIVVNDGSTDRTAAIVDAFGGRVRRLDQPNMGIGASRNHGIRECSGEFISFLDADDLWPQNKLELQLAAFTEDPELQHVFGMQRCFAGPDISPALAAAMPTGPVPAILTGTMLSRRASVMALGSFPVGLGVGEFIGWYARARELGQRERILPQVLLHRRVHSQNLTLRNREAFTDYARVIHQVLQRRRASEGK